MCGRYALTTPRTAVAEHFDAVLTAEAEAGFGNAGPRWNVCPTTKVPVVRATPSGGRVLVPMRWGFLPHWYKALNGGPLLINARSETIASKPAFGAAARARRCLIPADGFYEWLREGKTKQPFWAHPTPEDAVVAFAGVWQAWRGPDGVVLETCAIVTCEASPPLSGIHHREPVTVRAGDEAMWLGEAGRGAARLMHAAPEGFWTLRKVSPAVNSNRAEGPELIAPWDG